MPSLTPQRSMPRDRIASSVSPACAGGNGNKQNKTNKMPVIIR
jgi:hypothetical protein